ncbi:PQQ-like beta-propeller repeat protein [bacterium]|nr:PQQ-like beta-propeller repeat protein [bacterium]
MNKKRIELWLLIVCMVISLGVEAAYSAERSASDSGFDWPQWRGPNRDGLSPETGLLKNWPENGPEELWRISVGAGFSGVSVADGKLYTMWNENDSQYLICLDALSGKEFWRHRAGPAYFHNYGDGPRASPAIEAGRVFVLSAKGNLVALHKEMGTVLWEHNLELDYEAQAPEYGFASSPMIAGDQLLVETGASNATFMAFDKKDGRLLWGAGRDIPAYSSPISATIAGVQQVIFWSGSGLHGLGLSDGRHLWKFAWETLCPVTGVPLNTATPILAGQDRIFISSGSGAALIHVELVPNGFKTRVIWESTQMKNTINSSVIFENHIYGFDGGILKCVELESGRVKWRARGFQRGSLIVADSQLIVLGEQGRIALVEADPIEYRENGRVQIMNGRSWTSPTLAMGKLYVRNQQELVCLDLADSLD